MTYYMSTKLQYSERRPLYGREGLIWKRRYCLNSCQDTTYYNLWTATCYYSVPQHEDSQCWCFRASNTAEDSQRRRNN